LNWWLLFLSTATILFARRASQGNLLRWVMYGVFSVDVTMVMYRDMHPGARLLALFMVKQMQLVIGCRVVPQYRSS
jgi:hypothetical protein